MELSANGSALSYSREFPGGAVGQALTVDPNGVVHAAGETGLISTITPEAMPSARILGIMNAAGSVLSGRISSSEVISIFGFGLGPTTAMSATPE